MGIELISLLVLALTIFIGYKRKVNTGILCIAAAVLLGFFVEINISKNPEIVRMVAISSRAAKGKVFIAGWNTKLFFILTGMTLLFGIAKVNGTLDLLARKTASLAKGNRKLLPLIFFVFSAILSAMGPGNIAVCALVLPIALAVSHEEKISALLMSVMVIAGAQVGALSPIAPTGIIGIQLTEKVGLDVARPVFINMIKANAILAIFMYFVLGGHKLEKGKKAEAGSIPKFNLVQFQTLLVIGLVVLAIIFLKLNIGMVAFLGAGVLLTLKAANQKDAIAAIPWSTLLLVVGVGMLVNVIGIAGGIDYLTETLSKFMNSTTAAPIMNTVAGLMSAVSSASGVVMPTLIPTASGLSSQLGGSVTPDTLVSAIVVGAHAVVYSPLSTLGALAMAALHKDEDSDKIFGQLLLIGFGGIIFSAILIFVGIVG